MDVVFFFKEKEGDGNRRRFLGSEKGIRGRGRPTDMASSIEMGNASSCDAHTKISSECKSGSTFFTCP